MPTMMLQVVGRKPFVFPSGCSRVSVPEFSSISVCSLPELQNAGVSPRPIVFNIPQLPTPQRAQACIDIVPKITIKPKRIDRMTGFTHKIEASFKNLSGFTDCLEGRYQMNMQLDVPCQKLVISGGNAVSVKQAAGFSPKSCTYKLRITVRLPEVHIDGFNGCVTTLDQATAKDDGVWMRYVVMCYSNGILKKVNGRQQRNVARGFVPASGVPVEEQIAKAMAYHEPGVPFKIIGFTRCSS